MNLDPSLEITCYNVYTPHNECKLYPVFLCFQSANGHEDCVDILLNYQADPLSRFVQLLLNAEWLRAVEFY